MSENEKENERKEEKKERDKKLMSERKDRTGHKREQIRIEIWQTRRRSEPGGKSN